MNEMSTLNTTKRVDILLKKIKLYYRLGNIDRN